MSDSDHLHVPEEPPEERGESDEGAGEAAPHVAGKGKAFGGMSPAEAGRRRWALQRERDAAELEAVKARADGDTRTVLVPVSVGAIITRLDKDAQQGSVSSAKELRAWLDAYPPSDAELDLGDLDRTTRARMKAALLAQVQQEDLHTGTVGGAQ